MEGGIDGRSSVAGVGGGASRQGQSTQLVRPGQ
jgi:hypothetical protein